MGGPTPLTALEADDGPRDGAELEAVIVDSIEWSRELPTCISLIVDEPFFSDDLLLPPPTTAGEGVVVVTSPVVPRVVGPTELEASPTSQAGLQFTLVSVPAIRPAMPRLGGSYAMSSSTGPAQSLADPDSETLGISRKARTRRGSTACLTSCQSD